MAGQVKPIPVPVILAAVNGDENALAAVVEVRALELHEQVALLRFAGHDADEPAHR